MIRKTLLTALLLTVFHAQAAYQCDAHPQQDISVTRQSVTLSGKQGKMVITPDGNITVNQRAMTVKPALRQQAIEYQAVVRRDMPWIYHGAHQRLEKAYLALDSIITEKLGSDSKIHQPLNRLNTRLNQQLDRIISQDNREMVFHHQAIDPVRSDSDNLIQSAMGGILQDSLNELGNIKTLSAGNNPLQAIIGNLGGLQQSVQQAWQRNEADFQQFGQQVCQRVTEAEAKRHRLYQAVNF